MASRGVSVLKFVGTVSLGLLTGLSYTLSTLTVPTLLTLPSASTAAKAFRSLTTTARTHLRTLAGVSGTAFFLAFALSPRPVRHPYLLYTSTLIALSRLAASDLVAPYLFAQPQTATATATATSSSSLPQRRPSKHGRKDRSAARHMEMSYDVIGSDAHSEASASDGGVEEEAAAADGSVNGEEVRGEVESFLKKQMVSTAVAGLSFAMAVVGIWGDGAAGYVETVVNVVEF
ncbi:Autophagy-related protein 33 [Cytospora mali]|uniref:Autophagy-related protein 33 n=1 Tax=Cytospora mali TaxID=578113 RepID=A0A194VW14_CYTMA|nr:Autophagy-related protein 33 [Valsa mali]